METVFGPSGQITGSLFEAFAETSAHLINNRPVMLGESALKVLRQPSGLDNMAKAIGVWNNSLYQTKNGAVFSGQLKSSDALIIALGFTPLEVIEAQSYRTQTYNSSKKFREFSRDISRKAEVARHMLRSDSNRDEKESGILMLRELDEMIGLSGFSPKQMLELRRSAWSKNPSDWYTISQQLLKEDRYYAERRLTHVMRGNE